MNTRARSAASHRPPVGLICQGIGLAGLSFVVVVSVVHIATYLFR